MSRDISLEEIQPDPDQARKHFDSNKLGELAQSMGANGLAVPILLRPVGDHYVILHGYINRAEADPPDERTGIIRPAFETGPSPRQPEARKVSQ